MPTFHFATDAGRPETVRAEAELPSIRAAQIEAVQFLGELLKGDGSEFWTNEEASMTVSDENGLVLFRLYLGAVKGAALLRASG